MYRKLSVVLQFIAKKVFPDVEKEAESEEKSEERTETEAANLDILKKLRKSKCHLLLSEDNLYIVHKKVLVNLSGGQTDCVLKKYKLYPRDHVSITHL